MVLKAASGLMSVEITKWPEDASSIAVDFPIPEPAPVTNAISSFFMIFQWFQVDLLLKIQIKA
jgi:hypothetical protein